MALSIAWQQTAHLQRLQNLVLGELVVRRVDQRWGSPEGMVEAAQAGDSVAAGIVETLQRATQRRGIQWPMK
jgi:hypothetical protein